MTNPLRESFIRITGKRDRHAIMSRLTLDGILRREGAEVAPAPEGWAASASLLMILARIVTELPIKRVLELGCGQSTIMLAELARIRGFELTTIEHDARWANFIGERSGHEIELAALNPDGNGYVLNDLPGPFDLILVDGPPGDGSRTSRHGNIRAIEQHGAHPRVVVVDDTHRRGERRLAAALASPWEVDCIVKEIRSTSWQTVIATGPQFSAMARSLA